MSSLEKTLNEKGVVSTYNKKDVETREYYYDRYVSDKAEQDEFTKSVKELDKVNDKLKKELEKGEKANFKLTKEG